MIKPGTPVRCWDAGDDSAEAVTQDYIGPLKSGGHYAEGTSGDADHWDYVEELPRVLKKGDPVFVSDESLDKCTIAGYKFDGMYGGQYVCKSMGSAEGLVFWGFVIHVDDVESNND